MDIRRWAIAAACVLASVGGARAQSAASALENGAAASTVQRVEIAFCVDCSGSMGPAMNAAKNVIVDIARRRAATSPGASVRVGILRYGDGERRFQLLPLTERLDLATEFLQKTRIDSGRRAQEPVGTFLRKAIADMGWTNGKAVRRYLYVVGNEAAQQGSNTYQRALADAREQNISVGGVYCALFSPIVWATLEERKFDAVLGFRKAVEDWQEIARPGGGELRILNGDSGQWIVYLPAAPFKEDPATSDAPAAPDAESALSQ